MFAIQSMGCKTFMKRILTNVRNLNQGVTSLIIRAQPNGSGDLGFDDLKAYFIRQGVAMEEDYRSLKAWITEVDFDYSGEGASGDGNLSFQEIKTWAVRQVGVRGDVRAFIEAKGDMYPGVEAFMQAMDVDKDGVIGMKELFAYTYVRGSAVGIQEVRLMFRETDTNGSGVLDKDEIHSWCVRTMGCEAFLRRVLTNVLDVNLGVETLMALVDTKKDGLLTQDELVTYCRGRKCSIYDDLRCVRQWIADVDYDGDGFISVHDVKMWLMPRLGLCGDIMEHLKEPGSTLDSGLAAYMHAADLDDDGKLSQDDMRQYSLFRASGCSEEEISKLFSEAAGKDGLVSLEELREWCLVNMGPRTFLRKMLTQAANIHQGIERLIAQADKSGDGKLTAAELRTYLKERGVPMEDKEDMPEELMGLSEAVGESIGCKYLKAFIEEVDISKDGTLNLEELKMWIEQNPDTGASGKPSEVYHSPTHLSPTHLSSSHTTHTQAELKNFLAQHRPGCDLGFIGFVRTSLMDVSLTPCLALTLALTICCVMEPGWVHGHLRAEVHEGS